MLQEERSKGVSRYESLHGRDHIVFNTVSILCVLRTGCKPYHAAHEKQRRVFEIRVPVCNSEKRKEKTSTRLSFILESAPQKT